MQLTVSPHSCFSGALLFIEPSLCINNSSLNRSLASDNQAAHIFEGLSTFAQMDAQTVLIRLGLMAVGFLLIYLSATNTLLFFRLLWVPM
jgi:hypothetical protein